MSTMLDAVEQAVAGAQHARDIEAEVSGTLLEHPKVVITGQAAGQLS